jgi:hypothetical protein
MLSTIKIAIVAVLIAASASAAFARATHRHIQIAPDAAGYGYSTGSEFGGFPTDRFDVGEPGGNAGS